MLLRPDLDLEESVNQICKQYRKKYSKVEGDLVVLIQLVSNGMAQYNARTIRENFYQHLKDALAKKFTEVIETKCTNYKEQFFRFYTNGTTRNECENGT